MKQVLGIDTSNYTTSVALLCMETGEIRQAKQLLPVKPGEAGLRQSDAVFHHTKQLPVLLASVAEAISPEALCAIGVSARPRNVEGSYMPCFLTGLGTAQSLHAVCHVPVYETSHQVGHILAALYSAGQLSAVHQPFLAFHISGGTTDLLYCAPDAAQLLRIKQVGGSLDLKAGQAIDRVGLLLGLQFPCGKALEQLACKSYYAVPVRPVVRGTSCCLSGLENQCQKLIQQGTAPEDVAKYCLMTVGETLCGMAQNAKKQYGDLPILYAGGVMSNQLIRPLLQATGTSWFAAPDYACDNAAGVAIYGAWRKEGDILWRS